jgi:hypothetical protein
VRDTQYDYKLRKCASGYQYVISCRKSQKKYFADSASTYKEARELADALVVTLNMS